MADIEVRAAGVNRQDEILTGEALGFLAGLEREFGGRRRELLSLRDERQEAIAAGEMPGFLTATKNIREDDWRVAEAPADLKNRRVEITGPTDRKMVINALNCGAKVFMADFEDANTPAWTNLISGQANLIDAIERTISLDTPEGKSYRLNDQVATLIVRPRGWHLPEKHLLVDGSPMSGSLFAMSAAIRPKADPTYASGSGRSDKAIRGPADPRSSGP